jgi:signal recognition particle receptor subunit beta
MTKSRKPQTTVAMDYGLIRLSDNERVHLYGTPGQERFDFMWDILTKGGIGLVLMLDNTRKDPFQDMRFYTNAFRDFIEKQQMVVGVTRMDLLRKPGLAEYRQCLESLSLQAPIFEVDARSHKDVTMLIQALLFSLDPGVTN